MEAFYTAVALVDRGGASIVKVEILSFVQRVSAKEKGQLKIKAIRRASD